MGLECGKPQAREGEGQGRTGDRAVGGGGAGIGVWVGLRVPGGKISRDASWGMLRYERFEAWQWAHRLALDVFEVTERWPRV